MPPPTITTSAECSAIVRRWCQSPRDRSNGDEHPPRSFRVLHTSWTTVLPMCGAESTPTNSQPRRMTPDKPVEQGSALTLDTPRLTLRPFKDDDVDPLFAIQGDREAMQYTHAASSR